MDIPSDTSGIAKNLRTGKFQNRDVNGIATCNDKKWDGTHKFQSGWVGGCQECVGWRAWLRTTRFLYDRVRTPALIENAIDRGPSSVSKSPKF